MPTKQPPIDSAFSDAAVASVLADVLGGNDYPEAPRNLGAWKLLEKIGEGGFGIVWHAEQQEPLPRKAAIKLIKPGIDSEEVLARFQREQLVLARLDHPGIARVFEAGLTPDERPYIVMELVRGLPITTHCQNPGLDLIAKVALFRQACHALQHAHEKGVIHRDLKPSNLLVTEVDGLPQVKIIDFGIAKALSHEGQRQLTWMTRQQRLIGTPAYMSPEQTRAHGVTDVRTDIYALGVLLHELLTGKPLFPASLSLQEKLHQIREVDPQRPIGDGNDLDWITLRCLEKDPARRYPGIEALIDDLDRWRQGLPVNAHPPSRSYRVHRWIQRHRSTALGLIIILLALFIGTGTALWQAYVATQSQRESLAVEQALIQSMHQASTTKIGRQPRAYDLAKQVLDQIKAGTFPGSPAALHKILRAGSTAAMEASDHDMALWAKLKALNIAPSLPEFSMQQLYHERALILGALLNAERNEEAILNGKLWLEEARATFGPSHPNTLQIQMLAAEAMRAEKRPGFLELQQDTLAKAEAAFPEMTKFTTEKDARILLSEIESKLARSFNTAGRHQEALDHADRLIPLLQSLFNQEDPKVWFTQAQRGIYMVRLGRRDEGLKLLQEVVAKQSSLLGPKHPHTIWTQSQIKEAQRPAQP